MITTITIIIIVFLSAQVLPVALGIKVDGNWQKATLFIITLSLVQVIVYWLGLKLGGTFMYLMDGFKGVVFLLGFLLIGIRMLMETLTIRKGERSYNITKVSHVIFASLAQAINTFLAGVMFYYLAVNQNLTLLILFVLTAIIATIGLLLKPEKLNIAFASLLYAIGGLLIIISSIYITFFIL